MMIPDRLKKAARAGHVRAQARLANLLYFGERGVDKVKCLYPTPLKKNATHATLASLTRPTGPGSGQAVCSHRVESPAGHADDGAEGVPEAVSGARPRGGTLRGGGRQRRAVLQGCGGGGGGARDGKDEGGGGGEGRAAGAAVGGARSGGVHGPRRGRPSAAPDTASRVAAAALNKQHVAADGAGESRPPAAPPESRSSQEQGSNAPAAAALHHQSVVEYSSAAEERSSRRRHAQASGLLEAAFSRGRNGSLASQAPWWLRVGVGRRGNFQEGSSLRRKQAE
jgi:hypothetical protein